MARYVRSGDWDGDFETFSFAHRLSMKEQESEYLEH